MTANKVFLRDFNDISHLYSRKGYEELARVVDTDHSGERRIIMVNDTALVTSQEDRYASVA